MTNIQTLAARLKARRLKKYEALQIVENIYKDRQSVSDKDLAQLYRIFMPALPKKPKTDFDWLAKAVPPERDVRPYIQHIYCDGANAVATDGRRMHIAPCDNEPGYYDRFGNPLDWNETFPPWQRVAPGKNVKLDVRFDDLIIEVSNRGDLFYALVDDSGYAAHFSKRLVDDALSINGDAGYTVHRGDNSTRSPIRIDMDGGRTAVVMPKWTAL